MRLVCDMTKIERHSALLGALIAILILCLWTGTTSGDLCVMDGKSTARCDPVYMNDYKRRGIKCSECQDGVIDADCKKMDPKSRKPCNGGIGIISNMDIINCKGLFGCCYVKGKCFAKPA